MEWLTVVWSMIASACLAMGLLHLAVWVRLPRQIEHLLIVICAVSAAWLCVSEFLLFHAATPEEAGAIFWWGNIPTAVLAVGVAWFARISLKAGRLWLVWAITGLRAVGLIASLSNPHGLQFLEITGIRKISLLGEQVSVVSGIPNPWVIIAQISNLLFLVLVIDAAVTAWRRGLRTRAVLFGGSLSLFIVVAVTPTLMVLLGRDWPIINSLAYVLVLVANSFDASQGLVAASALSQKLAKSERKMSLAIRGAGQCVWDWDLVSGQIAASDDARAMYWFGSESVITFDRVEQRVHPDDLHKIRDAVQQAIREGDIFGCEYRILGPEGQLRWISASGVLEHSTSGVPVRMLGVSHDITSRRTAELEVSLRRSELEHLARVSTLGELSGSLAHELNQPLSAILSNAQAAQRFIDQGRISPEETREILSDIASEAQRAGEIIKRVRTLLRRDPVAEESLDINAVIRSTVGLLQSDLVYHNVRLRLDMADDLPPVFADEVHVQQALINLIMNACDAVGDLPPGQRQIVVKTTRHAEDRVALDVIDNGRGIPAEMLDRVFEPFVTTKPSGLGLGLSLTHMVITSHGGQLSAINNADGGATFRCLLRGGTTAAT
jgi:signal transduction histidine kinase